MSAGTRGDDDVFFERLGEEEHVREPRLEVPRVRAPRGVDVGVLRPPSSAFSSTMALVGTSARMTGASAGGRSRLGCTGDGRARGREECTTRRRVHIADEDDERRDRGRAFE